jgi:hypothetical protein
MGGCQLDFGDLVVKHIGNLMDNGESGGSGDYCYFTLFLYYCKTRPEETKK